MATNLYSQKDSNVRKTFVLMAVFLILIIAIGWGLSYYFGNPIILYVAVGVSILMNVFAYWTSDKIALAMSGAVALKKEQNLEYYRIVENLSLTAGLPMPRLYIIPGDQINAFATGRDPEHAAVAVTVGALRKLSKPELEGVLAHELSHVGNRDILVSTVVVVLAGVIAIISDIFMRMTIWGGSSSRKNSNPVVIVIAIVAAILAPIAATIIKLAVSRQREYLADASGALLTRYPDGLASALEKIAADQTPMRKAHNGTAHLFIANPLKGKEEKSWFAKLFMTHPPVHDRISRLRGMRE